ncbi:MAG: hypothetical protein V3S82_10430 [Dehalococcoidia bacterium]
MSPRRQIDTRPACLVGLGLIAGLLFVAWALQGETRAQQPGSLLVCVMENWTDEDDPCLINYLGCGAFLITGTNAPGRGQIIWCDPGDELNDTIAPTASTLKGSMLYAIDIDTKAKFVALVTDFNGTNDVMMGDGRGFTWEDSTDVATQTSDEVGNTSGTAFLVFNDDPTFTGETLHLEGIVVGDNGVVDQLAMRVDLGGGFGDDWYDVTQFYDASAGQYVMYAAGAANNGLAVRTKGGGPGSEGLTQLQVRMNGIVLGDIARNTPTTMNGGFISTYEANFHGGFRKSEKVGIVASVTQTRAAATECVDANGSPMNICIIATSANAGDAVKLPPMQDGRNQCWYNDGAQAATLWTFGSGEDLGNGTGNTMSIAVARQVCCETAASPRWYCVTSTPE